MRKLLFLPAIGCGLLSLGPAHAAPTNTDALKAAITLNLIRYIDFPKARSDGAIRLCVTRNLSAAQELARLQGQRVNNRTIAYRAIDEGASASCDVVVAKAGGQTDIMHYRETSSVVIGDGAGALNAGSTIGLVRTGAQIRFEINTRAAREAGVTISSKILRLAARVQQ